VGFSAGFKWICLIKPTGFFGIYSLNTAAVSHRSDAIKRVKLRTCGRLDGSEIDPPSAIVRAECQPGDELIVSWYWVNTQGGFTAGIYQHVPDVTTNHTCTSASYV